MRGDHYTFSCHMIESFLDFEHARRRHNASFFTKMYEHIMLNCKDINFLRYSEGNKDI